MRRVQTIGWGMVLMLLLAMPSQGQAQAKRLKGVEQKKAEFQITRGVWLHGAAGLNLATYGGLETALVPNTALSFEPDGVTGALPPDPFTARMLGSSFNIQLGGILRRRFIANITADFKQHRVGTTFKGEARLDHAAFGAQLGYAVINKSGWLVYPFVGFTTGTSQLTIQNNYIDPINFGDQEIGRSQSGFYDASLSTVEVGVSTRQSLTVGGRRGRAVMIGADLGGYFGVSGGNWTPGEGTSPTGVEAHKLSGGYLRITIGGALFDSDKPLVRRRSAELAPAEEKAPDLKNLFDQKEPAPDALDLKEDPTKAVPAKENTDSKKSRKAKRGKEKATDKPAAEPKKKTQKRRKDGNYDESEFDKKN